MNFSHFFIDRPIFASVTSIVIVIVGGLALIGLPVAQYPEIAPPTIQITASYPGASAQVIAETVAAPIEQEVNGVENMLYMSSSSTSDGQMNLTVTFKLGTDLNTAQVLVQNRVALAEAKLPEDVKRTGVVVKKRAPSFILIVNLVSPDNRYDQLYLSNFANLQVRDELARVPGVGDVSIFGGRDYAMRIWLDPGKLASRSLSVQDVLSAVREQNIQVAAGKIGAPPAPEGVQFQFSLSTQGRLVTEEEFAGIVIKRGADGQVILLKDVARVQLGAKDYSVNTYLDGKPCVTVGCYQLPGGNAINTAKAIRVKMAELKERLFPQGVDFEIRYDTTLFVQESVNEVIKTFQEAILLVVLVVLIFLQNWRATLIPLVAVPVSLIGTFAVMQVFGFSLNNISLFGLILAIGIVVDDAIVVVENVERNLNSGTGVTPRDAARKAMDEVSGPIVAIALVLAAVFIPTAFISGITGQFFRQFALTIAVSTLISAFNSLTLSPALAALLLRPHHGKQDFLTRSLNFLVGWFFKLFNTVFDAATSLYARAVGRLIRLTFIVSLVYLGLLGLTYVGFTRVPVGFVPDQDKGYLIINVQLPDAASLERTGAIVRQIEELARTTHGVAHTISLVGNSIVSGSVVSNAATIFLILDDFHERNGLRSNTISADLQKQLAGITEASTGVFSPPPVDGLGSTGGLKALVQDRASLGFGALQGNAGALVGEGFKRPEFRFLFSSFRSGVPQLYVDVDRVKAKAFGVALGEIFTTLQTELGSAYVNDFTFLGRTYQVTAQADAEFRRSPEDIVKLKVRNDKGEMVPLGSLVTVRQIGAPDRVVRYNLFPAADVNIVSAPGVSSGDAIRIINEASASVLPQGMSLEWTDIAYQQIIAGNTMIYIFPICVLMVFLLLAAQYESWLLPLAIILVVPMCLLCAITAVSLSGLDNNIFIQIGLVVLVGLACKNAILIVEFAKVLQDGGKTRHEAAQEACRLRLRPILMTSFAFILGCVPLLIGTGAGSEMRYSLGTAVVYGMAGVTVFGVFLTPVFYVIAMRFGGRKAGGKE